MGSVLCCLHVPDVEENNESDGSDHGNCLCPNCFLKSLMEKYRVLFGRRDISALPSSNPGLSSSNSTIASPQIEPLENNRSRETQLSNDVNSINTEFQQGKGIGNSNPELESLRTSNNAEIGPKQCSGGNKKNGSDREGGSRTCRPESSTKVFPEEVETSVETSVGHVHSSSEDEDVCPTCLEEYTPENPKIVTQCSHEYHLGCIYEWMERSENCPICGKLMIFE